MQLRAIMGSSLLVGVVAAGAVWGCAKPTQTGLSDSASFAYPLDSEKFDTLVADSYKVAGNAEQAEFKKCWTKAFESAGLGSPEEWARQTRVRLAKTTNRTEIQRLAAVQVFRVVKKSLPTFDLDRGYEFTNAAENGQRQCLLQSVLIASTLQQAGLDAGCVMVWSNERGEVSNLGHVATFVKLNNGRQMLVDASDPGPFATHAGLFLVDGTKNTYRFVRPNYDKDREIEAFATADSAPLDPKEMFKALDYDYLRSQFDFYRAERIPGGFLDHHAEPEPLKKSLAFFEASVAKCDRNPLAMLCYGRTQLRLGDARGAETIARARSLYEAYGWLPPGIEGS